MTEDIARRDRIRTRPRLSAILAGANQRQERDFMATTMCGKCGKRSFEIVEISPAQGRYKHNVIQCSACGTPIGITNFQNLGTLIDQQDTKISFLIAQTEKIESLLSEVLTHLRRQ